MDTAKTIKELRESTGMTQEDLAEKLDVSRQAVTKWESGQVYPDISNLIRISNLFNVTVDYMVRDQECMVSCENTEESDINKLIEFRLEANVNTYAACMNETDSTRLDSHDFSYNRGPYTYHDTYVGGEKQMLLNQGYVPCNKQIHIKIPEDELQMIHDRIEQIGVKNMSAYIRKMAIDGYYIHVDFKELFEIIRLMRIDSNNINQIAKAVNSYGVADSKIISDMKDEHERVLKKVEKCFDKYLEIM